MEDETNTTIVISKETRESLKLLGTKDETYDAIIARLMKIAKQQKISKDGSIKKG